MKYYKKQRQTKKVNFDVENETSSSEDDEDAEFLTEEVEKGFFKVLSKLKRKDAKLYDEAVRYYPTNDSEPGTSSRQKGAKQTKQEYKEWLKGELKKVDDDGLKEDLEGLHDFWANPKISKEDQFLRDYILNKKFLEPDKEFDVQKELEQLSDEEKEIEEQLTFEQKYNCRFENPDNEFLQKYPHTVGITSEEKLARHNVKKKKKLRKPHEENLSSDTTFSICNAPISIPRKEEKLKKDECSTTIDKVKGLMKADQIYDTGKSNIFKIERKKRKYVSSD